jgi:ATP-binding cassette, subfamily F, member 2
LCGKIINLENHLEFVFRIHNRHCFITSVLFHQTLKMPSDSKKKEMQRKKDARNKKVNGGKTETKAEDGTSSTNGVEKKEMTEEEMLCAKLEEEARINMEARSCTGTLATHPRSRDIKIENFSITFYGAELLQDTMLELNCGRRVSLNIHFLIFS